MSRVKKEDLPFSHYTIDFMNTSDEDLYAVKEKLGLGY